MSEPEVTAFVCGVERCPEGGEHDSKETVRTYWPNGNIQSESVACSKCLSSAMDRDILRLP